MSNLKTKKEVIERYWPDYLGFCMRSQENEHPEFHRSPTINGFWQWYITEGPMGVKHRNLYYNNVNEDRYV